jgi:hypothetical protein
MPMIFMLALGDWVLTENVHLNVTCQVNIGAITPQVAQQRKAIKQIPFILSLHYIFSIYFYYFIFYLNNFLFLKNAYDTTFKL